MVGSSAWGSWQLKPTPSFPSNGFWCWWVAGFQNASLICTKVWYVIVGFNVALDTLQVISGTILRFRWPNQQRHTFHYIWYSRTSKAGHTVRRVVTSLIGSGTSKSSGSWLDLHRCTWLSYSWRNRKLGFMPPWVVDDDELCCLPARSPINAPQVTPLYTTLVWLWGTEVEGRSLSGELTFSLVAEIIKALIVYVQQCTSTLDSRLFWHTR